MLAVKLLSQFRGGDLVAFIPVLQLEGDVKEPVTLFDKSRGLVGSDVMVYLTCAVFGLGGRGGCDQNMD